ncbi:MULTISPECIES: PqqD family peptide modification chaperone [Streptomyces]|uniref:PqqD family protein n=2 Tax=Streptomyces TaxID=1883 RepID=A0A7X6CYL2_9ACTN|nr:MULTISPECIES: PqqD family peptide modification chaperone [Streptomyces]NJQ04947.1 PqqD family protein [Streptomyces lonarensis]NJQ13628.1 PqqD family protein [Streptomyces bohaiensis]
MTYRLADGVTVAETDGGTVILDLRTGAYRLLNESGAAVLRHLTEHGAQGDAPARAIAELSARHPEAADAIPGDVHLVVRALLEAKVVERS